jgi:hypothetical protein
VTSVDGSVLITSKPCPTAISATEETL